MLKLVDTFLFWVSIGQTNTLQRPAYFYSLSSALTFITETGCVVGEVRADHVHIAVESNRLCSSPFAGCLLRSIAHCSYIQGVPGGMCQTSRLFLMLKYTDITQNTHVQSWTVTEIKAREKCGLLAVPSTVPGSRDVIPIRCALSVLVYSRLKRVPRCDCTCKVLGNPKDNYDISASVFVVQFNGFMSLTS